MNPSTPFPPNNQHPSNPTDYHSVYHGTSQQEDGNFSHFVRAIDSSHMQGGYWRYRSVEDDRIALAYGFEKPEDLLVAVENSLDCEEYDDITLLWMKGYNDPNLRGVLCGTAKQHLQIIYEVRQLLGLPMSSRGQIPTYPISIDPRLKSFWDRIYETQSSTSTVRPFSVINQAALSVAPPRPAAIQSLRSEHLQYVPNGRSHHRYMSPHPPEKTPSTRPPTTSTTQPPLALNNPTAMAAPSQKPLPANPSFNHTGSSGIVNAINSRQSSSSVIAPSVTALPMAASSTVASSSSSRAAPRAASSTSTSSTAATSLQPESAAANVRDLFPLHSPAPKRKWPPFIDLGFPPSVPKPVLGQASAIPTTKSLPDIAPTFVHGQPSATPIRNPFPSIDPKFVLAEVAAAPTTNHVPAVASKFVHGQPSAASTKVTPSNHTFPNTQYHSTSVMPENTNRSFGNLFAVTPSNTNSQMGYTSQPGDLGQLDKQDCMWCGYDDFHANDCPYGNLKYKKHLTTLEYHMLTDAVEQFDPGPWTVHFDQFPEAEREDPSMQIAGMAEIIRSEDSYKNDVKLHGLQDEHLVMLWALKSSEGVEIIDEQAGRS